MERLFNLDAQLLFDACVMALSMLVMFTFLSYLLFKPVRKLLEDRKQRVADEQESAKNDRKEAAVYKEEYEQKLKEIDKEAQAILSEARKKAMKTENEIVAEAKEEAARIITRANNEIELERKRALDDMKQEMISIASAMAGKVVAASIDTSVQDELIEETLKEMGEQLLDNDTIAQIITTVTPMDDKDLKKTLSSTPYSSQEQQKASTILKRILGDKK